MRAGRLALVVGVLAVGCLLGACTFEHKAPSYETSSFQMMIATDTVVAARAGDRGSALSEADVQKEVERLMALKPHAAAPRKLVLYEVPSSGPSAIMDTAKKIELRAKTSATMKEALVKSGIFAEVDFLPEILLPGKGTPDLKMIRIAAARAQADGLLIYTTEAGWEVKGNPLCLTYLTIVGALVVPGSRETSMALSKAVLVDVPTGYFYMVTESYGKQQSGSWLGLNWRPGLLLDSQQLEYDARVEAINALAQTVAAKVQELKKQ